MVDVWDTIKETAKSFGGVASAPLGFVVDVAQTGGNLVTAPFDEDDDSLLDHLSQLGRDAAKRSTQVLDPIINPNTATGAVVGEAMEKANWLLDNGINRPVSTLLTVANHMSAEGEFFLSPALFSADDWAQAWKISDAQNAGQSYAGVLLHPTNSRSYDPFDYSDPYDEYLKEEHSVLAPTISWGFNIAGALAADPVYLGAKGLGLARQASMADFYGLGKLKPQQRHELGTLLTSGSGADKRVTRFADFIAGENRQGRALTGPEVLAVSPELKKWAKEPQAIASLLADASKITDQATRRNTVKDILAVAGGDQSALDRVKSAKTAIPGLGDALKNMLRADGVLDLKKVAANPDIAHNPLFIRHFEDQLTRLNDDRSIDKFLGQWSDRLDLLAGTSKTLDNLPGLHHSGNRALSRVNDLDKAPAKTFGEAAKRGGVLRMGRNTHIYLEDAAKTKLDDWSRQHFAADTAKSTLLQKSAYHVPMMVVRTASWAVAPYTKMPVSISDAMRQTHFIATANLHDWGGSTTQLDSMMKVAHVPTLRRMEIIGRAGLVGDNEMAKQTIIAEAERESMAALAARYSEKSGRDIDRGYIEALMEDFSTRRGKTLAQLHGRAYASTSAPDELAGQLDQQQTALRAAGIQRAADQGVKGASQRKFKPTAPEGVNWRVDMILDDTGIPVHLPLMSSQLANQVPLIDVHLAKKLLKRDTSQLSNLSKAWRAESDELNALLSKRGTAKGKAAVALEKSIKARREAADWLQFAGQKALRAWKMSVLLRLGYPARVILDDHWRIWSQIGAASFYGENVPEALKNVRYNKFTRHRQARADQAKYRAQLADLLDERDSDWARDFPARMAEHTRLARSLGGMRGEVTKWRNRLDEEGADRAAIEEKIARAERHVAEKEAALAHFQAEMGDRTPEIVNKEIEQVAELLRGGKKGLTADKRRLGSEDFQHGDVTVEGAFGGGSGAAHRTLASSDDTFKYEMRGVEDAVFGQQRGGNYVTIAPDNPGHTYAWADVLNNQFRNSPEAMHFLKGGTVDEFVDWIKSPDGAAIRKRIPHFAHDPEEWGLRLEAMVHDYVPDEALRELLASGKSVKANDLGRWYDESVRPVVHGRSVADTIGNSHRALGVGRVLNRTFEFLASTPTDRLSRHPFFNALYKQHSRELIDLKKAHKLKVGEEWTQADLDEVATQSRKLALGDLKRTLYDLSAHSHAAHVMRFLSPFFAAHQEVLARWWRIVGENPGIVRRFQQAFDAPRYAGLTVDQDGNPVEPGAPISKDHRIMLPLPWGDKNWAINENSFNLVLQGGLTNPGVGPLVTVPMEQFVSWYPEDDDIRRVARVFNPFPPNSPMEALMPATFKRFFAVTEGATGVDPFGVGNREFNDLLATNITDGIVDFKLKMGREPSKGEFEEIKADAKKESLIEAMFKFANNLLSPFPARPGSKYALIQSAAWRYKEMGRERFPDDFKAAAEWAYAEFKKDYGDAYLPLLYSDVNNEAGLGGRPSEVAGFKKYQSIAQSLDPRLTRAVIGPEVNLDEEITPEARNYFENMPISVGTGKTYISDMDPAEAAHENLVRRGWARYNELTAALTAQAQQMGLESYEDSDALMAARKSALEVLKDENYAWAEEYGNGPDETYDALLIDLERLAESPLANDPTREDIRLLGTYLSYREQFMAVIKARQDAGLGGIDAAATEPIKALFRKVVGQLVERNTYFQSNLYDGVLDRDPLLAVN